jgi:hypothetical protein
VGELYWVLATVVFTLVVVWAANRGKKPSPPRETSFAAYFLGTVLAIVTAAGVIWGIKVVIDTKKEMNQDKKEYQQRLLDAKRVKY